MNKKYEKDIVAYFDFDGTITSCDTLLPFLLYVTGLKEIIFKLYISIPIFLLYVFKIIDNEVAKERTTTTLLKGKKEEFIYEKAMSFANSKIDHFIKPEVFSRLEYHLEHKNSIILVSANLAIYLRFWASRHNIENVIATEIEFKQGICTGKLATKNCYGQEKVNRVVKYLQVVGKKVAYSYGYGNSKGDYALLDYVDEGYLVSGDEIRPWVKNDK